MVENQARFDRFELEGWYNEPASTGQFACRKAARVAWSGLLSEQDRIEGDTDVASSSAGYRVLFDWETPPIGNLAQVRIYAA